MSGGALAACTQRIGPPQWSHVANADVVLQQLPSWFEEYNDNHPHKGLKMLSPREFRNAQLA